MSEIIKDQYTETITEHFLSYVYKNDSGAGFAFRCDEHGNPTDLNEVSERNLQMCKDGRYEVDFKGIETYSWDYVHSAILKCDCGEEVELGHFTNTCEHCERDYNWAGQLLAPREQWEG